MNVSRIGHGYKCLNSSKALKIIKENNIHIEACPTSSIATGSISSWKNHPVM